MNPVSWPILQSSSSDVETSNQIYTVAFIYFLPLLEFQFLLVIRFVPALILLSLAYHLTQRKGLVIMNGRNAE